MHLPSLSDTEELEALAIALERRAAERFRQMAAAMQARGRADLGALFERLAREEASHEATLRESSPEIDEERIERHWPAGLGEAPRIADAQELARASVYRCLADAVRNEEKAFRFFSYLAANSEDRAHAQRAEALAKEELEHAALLRRARRAAYHDDSLSMDAWPMRRQDWTLEKLRRVALPRELGLRDRLADLQMDGSRRDALDRTSAQILERLGYDGSDRSGSIEPAAPGDAEKSPAEECDEAFGFYDLVTGSTSEERAMLTAQRLAALSLERLKLLRFDDLRLRPESEPA